MIAMNFSGYMNSTYTVTNTIRKSNPRQLSCDFHFVYLIIFSVITYVCPTLRETC